MDFDRHVNQYEDPSRAQEDAPSVVETMLATLLVEAAKVTPSPDLSIDIGDAPTAPVIIEQRLFGLPHYEPYDPVDWPQRTLTELLPQADALGEYLRPLPPGDRLAKILAAIDPDKVDDYSLVEVVAAHKRMESWSTARAARAAASLAERPALNPTWPGTLKGRTRGECLAGHELAIRLNISKLAGTRLAAAGRAFKRVLSDTGAALELGLIDFPRAQTIFTHLDPLPDEVALAAQLEVLEKAPGRTLRQVQQDLAKAVIAVDPEEADARHRTACQQRRVHRPQALPDGMASFSAVLPAADAIALDSALDSAARAAKNDGSQRTLDQLRADSLALMGYAALELGYIGVPPEVQPQATDANAGTTPTASTTPTTPTASAPEAPEAPEACNPPPDTTEASPAVYPSGSAGRRPPCPGRRLPGGALPWTPLGRRRGARADIRVTVPLGVALPDLSAPPHNALERDPEPVPELDGYGPITPEVARALAAGGVWRRLIVDPITQEVLNVGRERYEPPPGIAELVRERDRTCVTPGCSTPARSCDLDHMHEWQDGGETSVWNFEPLCKTDHGIKTRGAYTVARASDGTYAFTALTGHGYLRRRDGTTVMLPRQTARELRALGKEQRRSGKKLDLERVDAVLAEVAAGSDVGGVWTPPTLPRRGMPHRDAGPSWQDDARTEHDPVRFTGHDAAGVAEHAAASSTGHDEYVDAVPSWAGDDEPPF